MNCTSLSFFLILKNAAKLHKEYIEIQYNKSFIIFLKSLYKEGFILSYEIIYQNNSPKTIKIFLRFLYNQYLLNDLQILSKPSHKKYLKYIDACKILNVRYVTFLSTNKGIYTHRDCQKKKIGGKLFYIC